MKRAWLILFCSSLRLTAAGAIPDSAAVRAILGEGANQTYQAMLGIACAIRNRGSLQGVYGVENPAARRAPARVAARALRAWTASAGHDITGGCHYFGSPQDAAYFHHRLHYRAVLRIGDITFYKP